jgi:hypothetical protein
VSQLLHWSRYEHHLFPAEFRAVVRQLVRGQHSPTSILHLLPMDVLELVIAHLARDPCSFASVPAASRPALQTDSRGSVDSESDGIEDDRLGDSERDHLAVSAAKRRAVAPASP